MILIESEYTQPYEKNSTQSQFARLDWSHDGQLLATTSGCIGGVYTSPLIRRGTSWTIEGHLKGHKKSINI